MLLHTWGKNGGIAGLAADTTAVDLRSLAPDDGDKADDWCFCPADFVLLVDGNDAAVTVTAAGPFPTNGQVDVTDGSFAIGGGQISMTNTAVGSIEFDTDGSAYTINIIRKISE